MNPLTFRQVLPWLCLIMTHLPYIAYDRVREKKSAHATANLYSRKNG
jgi:hypothetical protein